MQRKSCREGSLVNQASDAHLFEIIHLQSETIKHFIHLSYYTTPTSPFFSRPNGVVQRISKTIRDLWAREKKFVMSSLPRNLVVKKLLDRLERIAFVKVNSEEYYAVAALEERKSYLIMRIDKCYLFGCRKEEGSH